MQRKLVAIFSTDVQGYSRLMGDDEEATVRTITAYRQVMFSLIDQHAGRVVDSPGDNLLAEFASVVHALQCAVAVQQELAERNAALPESRKMWFRIGMNLGDVIGEGERIYGDGVNIAARIEALSEGGGICISGPAYDQVKNKLLLTYVSMGEHAFKNIKDPVRVYRVEMKPEPEPAPEPEPEIALRPAEASPQETQPTKRSQRWQIHNKKPLFLSVLGLLLLLFLAGAGLNYYWQQPAQNPFPLVQEAYQFLAQGEMSQAEAAFQRLGSRPETRIQSQAFAGLAAVAYDREDFDQALKWAGRAEQLDPEVVYSHVVRGHILFAQGNNPEATKSYRTAVDKMGGTLRQHAVAFNRLGRIFAERGFFGTALKYYDRAVGHHPNKAVVLANKAHLLEESGKSEEALMLYDQALQIRPDDPLTVTLLAWAERRKELEQPEEKVRIDAWVANILQAYQEKQLAPRRVGDDWTSAPLTLVFLPLPLQGAFAQRAGEKVFLLHHLTQALRASGRLIIIDRTRLDALLEALELSFAELKDLKMALQVGNILGVQLLVRGHILRSSTQVSVSLELIEMASHSVHAVTKVPWTSSVFEGLGERVARNLLLQVHQLYPLRGQISHITPQNILRLNLGSHAGVTPKLKMSVLGPDDRVGRIEVTDAFPQYSEARVLQQTVPFQVGWKVEEVP